MAEKKINAKIVILFIFSVFLIIPLISSAPPVTTVSQFPEGYVILEAQQPILKAGVNHTYYFFLYNSTDGKIIDNTTGVECKFYMADETGEIVIEGESIQQPNGYWKRVIPGEKLEDIGFYSYGVSCQDGLGGALAGTFEVTKTGFVASTSDSIIVFISILIMFLVAGMLLTLAFRINEGTFILIFYVLSTIILFMATLFSMTLLDNLVSRFDFIVEGYTAFVMVFKILLSMGVLSLILYAGIRALKMYKMKRGLIDE